MLKIKKTEAKIINMANDTTTNNIIDIIPDNAKSTKFWLTCWSSLPFLESSITITVSNSE